LTAATQKVLIIDDDTDLVLFLKGLMISNGFKPIIACTQAEGLKKARQECPCCIILNCMLCGEEGLCLYRDLKSSADLKAIPVIMLSSLPSEIVYRYRIFQMDRSLPQPEAYLGNPPEVDELIGTISVLTGQTSAQI